MLSLFKKRKTHVAVKKNAAQEKVANSIVTACIRMQKKWADFMQHYTERLSRNGKLIMFCVFCLLGGSLSLYLIASSIMRGSASSFTITHFKATPFKGKSGDENTKAFVIVTKAEYEKIQHFRFYMDSLASSTPGKKVYDSILNQRPGLMDSVLLIENIYQSQNKK